MMVREGVAGAGTARRLPTSLLNPDAPEQDDVATEHTGDEQPSG